MPVADGDGPDLVTLGVGGDSLVVDEQPEAAPAERRGIVLGGGGDRFDAHFRRRGVDREGDRRALADVAR